MSTSTDIFDAWDNPAHCIHDVEVIFSCYIDRHRHATEKIVVWVANGCIMLVDKG